MTFKEDTRLTPILMAPIMVTLFFGTGLFHVSSNAAKAMGANGYLGILLATIGIVPVIWASFALQLRFPGQTIIEYAPAVIGRIPAFIMNLGLFLFAYGYLILVMRDATILVSTYLLDRTPFWVIMAIGFGGVIYLSYHGIESIARFASFVFIPASLVILGLIVVGFINADLRYVLPVFSPRWSDYLRGGFRMFSIYLPVLFLWVLLAFLIEPAIRPARKAAFWSIGIVFIIFFLETFGAIAAFGPNGLSRYTWATMEYVHIINLPYLIIEQAGVLLIIAWIAMIYSSVSISYWVLAFGATRILRKPNYKIGIVGLALPGFILTQLPENIVQIVRLEEAMQNIGVYFILGYPLLLWLLATVFRKESNAS